MIACNDGKHQKQVKPKQDVKNHDLSFLGIDDTLIFSFTDEKCGEWGGDTRSIYIYKQTSKYPEFDTFADLIEYKMDCDSVGPEVPHKIAFKRNKILVNGVHQQLIMDAMEEYYKFKLDSDADNFSHSGCFSGIKTTDGKLYLSLYPSPKWKKFGLLFTELKVY